MFNITRKKQLSESVYLMSIHAPQIEKSRRAGQFVILQLGGDFNERFPLTIADGDPETGDIDIIYQVVGESTERLTRLEEGECIANVLGPLGNPSDVHPWGRCVCVGGGIGIAALYPIAEALHKNGNQVKSIIGARTEDLLIMEDKMEAVSEELIICTDDGSKGRKDLVTAPLEELCKQWKPDCVVVVGPPVMMKFCSLTTQKYNVKTFVSLNTLMVDGTGMCGSCRCTVGGETKFVCVDGPDFDAHQVDWDNMLARLATFKTEEAVRHEEA